MRRAITDPPEFRPGNVIREYRDHWKNLPARPSPAILKAIRDRFQANAQDGQLDQYGLELLKLAGAPLEEAKR
jgi:hypothetical protein